MGNLLLLIDYTYFCPVIDYCTILYMNVIHVYSLTNLLGIVEFYIISAQSNVCNLKISVIAEWES